MVAVRRQAERAPCGAVRMFATHDRKAVDQFTHDRTCALPAGHRPADTCDEHWCPCSECSEAEAAGLRALVMHAPWPTYWTERRAAETYTGGAA